jgi:hypothetical protein
MAKKRFTEEQIVGILKEAQTVKAAVLDSPVYGDPDSPLCKPTHAPTALQKHECSGISRET